MADAITDGEVRLVRVALELDRRDRTIGTEMKHTSVSFHDITTSNASEIARSNPFEMNWSNPNCTSSAIESTSDVMRETSTPAFSRSKNPSDSDCMWLNTRMRKSRRKPSPMRPTAMICTRATTYATAATTT